MVQEYENWKSDREVIRMSMLNEKDNQLRCKKCGHLGRFHQLRGEGFPTEYFYFCNYHRSSPLGCKCKEKEFIGV